MNPRLLNGLICLIAIGAIAVQMWGTMALIRSNSVIPSSQPQPTHEEAMKRYEASSAWCGRAMMAILVVAVINEFAMRRRLRKRNDEDQDSVNS